MKIKKLAIFLIIIISIFFSGIGGAFADSSSSLSDWSSAFSSLFGSSVGTETGTTSTSTSVGTGVYIPTGTETGLSDLSIKAILMNLLRWLLEIVGVIALIGFAIAGIQYILASGNEAQAETAKKNMMNAIMGIVVVLASLVIVQAIDYALRGGSSF